MSPIRFRIFFLAIGVGIILSSCCGYKLKRKAITRYAPFHPSASEPITFSIHAVDNDEIKTVELHLFEYELPSTITGTRVVARKRASGEWRKVKEWHPNKKRFCAEFTYTSGFPNNSYIKYVVKYIDGIGDVTSECWEFAAGNWPYSDLPIPILKNEDNLEKRVDLVFLRDRDDYYKSELLNDLQSVIYDGLQTSNAIRNYEHLWQFYYVPEVSKLNRTTGCLSSSAIEMRTGFHYGVLSENSSKWAFEQNGNFFSPHMKKGTIVHEAGHAIFELDHETTDAVISPGWEHHNMIDNYSDCETYNLNTFGDLPADACVATSSGIWYRVESITPSGCTMFDDGDYSVRDFSRTCLKRAEWFYRNRLGYPECICKPECRIPEVTPETITVFELEDIVIAEICASSSGYVASFRSGLGFPSMKNGSRTDLIFRGFDETGQERFKINRPNPREALMEEPETPEIVVLDSVKFSISFPASDSVRELELQIYRGPNSDSIGVSPVTFNFEVPNSIDTINRETVK